MADFCGECALLDMEDCRYGDRYYCVKKRDRFKTTSPACSDFVNKGKKKEGYKRAGCYITTIVCTLLGYPDDCETLNLMRSFREDYLKMHNRYLPVLYEYDQIGPIISEKLQEENDIRLAIFLLQGFILPCSIAYKSGRPKEALTIYQNMVNMLKNRYELTDIAIDLSVDTPLEVLGKGRIRVPKDK